MYYLLQFVNNRKYLMTIPTKQDYPNPCKNNYVEANNLYLTRTVM